VKYMLAEKTKGSLNDLWVLCMCVCVCARARAYMCMQIWLELTKKCFLLL